MSKADVIFGPEPELAEPLGLDFVASRPLAWPQAERGSDTAAAEDRPLYLNPARCEPQRGRPGTTYHGFALDPAAAPPARAPRPVRGSRSRRGLLAVGLTAVVGLAAVGALWSYPALERRTTASGNVPAGPAPLASPVGRPVQVATIRPLAEVREAKIPARLGARALAPSPALREKVLSEPARPERQEPRETLRPQTTLATPAASAATARANIIEAYAPQSTLSAQSAAQAQTASN